MKRIVSIIVFFFASTYLFGQEICNDDVIMRVKGKWIKQADNSMKGANLSQITSRIDKMQLLLQQAYPQPMGIEARWYRTMGGYYSAVDKSAVEYELSSRFFTWYCNIHVKKLLLGSESGNIFNVWVNKFKWFATKDENFPIDNNPVYLLSKKLGEHKGHAIFAGNDNNSSNTGTRFSKTIMITRSGQLPYKPVTRRQYLLAFVKQKNEAYQSYMESLSKTPVRSDAEEEVFKQQQLDKVVNAKGNELAKDRAKANFLRGYTTEKQRKEASIERTKKTYEQEIKAANEYLLNKPEIELAKPAYLQNGGYISSFRDFADEKEGLLMVQVNSNYFNKTLPSYVPQFMIVYWTWNTEKSSRDFADHIEKYFDFDELAKLIDK